MMLKCFTLLAVLLVSLSLPLANAERVKNCPLSPRIGAVPKRRLYAAYNGLLSYIQPQSENRAVSTYQYAYIY